jgi:general secretion pathway protein C
MPKRLLPVNIFLTCLIIALTAKIAADLVSYRLGRLVPAVGRKISTAPAPSPASEDLASFAPILEKGLFGKATQGLLTPITQATPQKQAAPTLAQGELTLLGTVQGSYRETFALVQKTSSKEERVFRLGDTVFNIGPLVAVHKESAEILSGNQRVKLYTPQAAPAAAPGAAAQAPAQAGSLAAQVGAGSYVIDQRALNASLDNIGQAMTDARLLPSVKEGKVEGFRVSEVKPQGIFGTVGIKNGDVLLRINDFPIDSPEKAIQSFATLKGQSRIKLDLIRDGQPTTFTYDIR